MAGGRELAQCEYSRGLSSFSGHILARSTPKLVVPYPPTPMQKKGELRYSKCCNSCRSGCTHPKAKYLTGIVLTR